MCRDRETVLTPSAYSSGELITLCIWHLFHWPVHTLCIWPPPPPFYWPVSTIHSVCTYSAPYWPVSVVNVIHIKHTGVNRCPVLYLCIHVKRVYVGRMFTCTMPILCKDQRVVEEEIPSGQGRHCESNRVYCNTMRLCLSALKIQAINSLLPYFFLRRINMKPNVSIWMYFIATIVNKRQIFWEILCKITH